MMRWIGRVAFVLLVFVLSATTLQAQNFIPVDDLEDWEPIDTLWPKIKAIHRTATEQDLISYVAFADFVNRQGLDELERAALIYYAITKRVRYHTYRLRDPDLRLDKMYKEPDFVWRNRIGICSDYAQLFCEIGAISKVQCHKVRGYSRLKEDTIDWTHTNHAWVIFRANGFWHLADPTWGAGYAREDQFVEKFDQKWFDTNPLVFALTHIPIAPMFQLLPCPISANTYRDKSDGNLPYEAVFTGEWINFQDSIDAYLTVPEKYKDAALARQAYNYNPENTIVLAYEFYKRGYHLYYEHRDKELTWESLEVFSREIDYIIYLFETSKSLYATSKSHLQPKYLLAIEKCIIDAQKAKKLLGPYHKDAKWWVWWITNENLLDINGQRYLPTP